MRPSSAVWTRALAATGLVLYPFALHLPIMRVERFGRVSTPNIWDGTITLLRDGELFVGGVVFVCSVVFPLIKLLGLWIVAGKRRWLSPRGRGRMYRVIDWTGRWGMLDVLVLSLLVAVVKFTDWFEILPGPGALVFTLCVLASLLSAAAFDTHTLWEDHD